MDAIKALYLRAYLIVMALYVYLNKGIAYSYLVEALWLGGIVLLILNRHKYIFNWDKRIKILFLFMFVTLLYIIRGAKSYPLIETIRDSFIFEYGWFVFILFIYQEQQNYIWDQLFAIYKWFPLVALVNFILQYYVPFFDSFTVFGDITLLLYKYGDMSVHLLICTLLIFLNINKLSNKWLLILTLLILFDFLIISAYSRAGMLAFVIGIFCFIFLLKINLLKRRLKISLGIFLGLY